MRQARRRFLQAGLAGAALLAAAARLDRAFAGAPADLRFLDARGAALVRALAVVVLEGALPGEESARRTALEGIAPAFDRAVSGLGVATREEIGELFSVLLFPPTRFVVAGVRSSWEAASPAELRAFLEDWRTSRFALKRSGYRALTQLIQAAWFDNPLAWPLIGYPGPPAIPARS